MSIDFDLLLALTRSDDGRLYMNASMIYREQMKIGSIGLISKLWQMQSLWHIFSPSYFLCTGENIISRKGIFVISGMGHFKSIGQAVDIIFHSDWSEMSFFFPLLLIFLSNIDFMAQIKRIFYWIFGLISVIAVCFYDDSKI